MNFEHKLFSIAFYVFDVVFLIYVFGWFAIYVYGKLTEYALETKQKIRTKELKWQKDQESRKS